MKNVEEFLKRVKGGINRQVYIEAKVVEVQLNNDKSLGIDWNELDFGSLVLGTDLIIDTPAGGATALPPTIPALTSVVSTGYSIISMRPWKPSRNRERSKWCHSRGYAPLTTNRLL